MVNSRSGSAWMGGGGQCSDTFGDYSSRIRRKRAEELGIVIEEEENEMEAPLPPWHHRTGVGEGAPEAGDNTAREEEERRRAEANTEAMRQLEACLPLRLDC